MNESMKSRLLEYARELVDQKIAEKQLFAGSNVSVMDKMISLQHGVFARPEEISRAWIRVWAEVTMIQTTTPDAGNSPGGGAAQDGVFTYPPFPVFTLPAEDPTRQAVLDDLEYYLENAEEFSSPTTLLYTRSLHPVLDSPGTSWAQGSYPPYPATYPGFTPDPDEYNPLRVGESTLGFTFDDPVGLPPWGTITKTASVTFYVKSHGDETLEEFSLGGAVRLYRITTRQVGSTAYPSSAPPNVPKDKVLVQDFNADHTGQTIIFSGISDAYESVDEIVHIIGFEPLTS